MTAGLRKLKVEFSIPSPDTAAYYEYTVRSSTGLKVRCLPGPGYGTEKLAGQAIHVAVRCREPLHSWPPKLVFSSCPFPQTHSPW